MICCENIVNVASLILENARVINFFIKYFTTDMINNY